MNQIISIPARNACLIISYKGQIDGEENQRKGEENQRKGEGQSGRIEGENGRKVKREEKIKKVKGNEISVKTKEAVFSMILFELSA